MTSRRIHMPWVAAIVLVLTEVFAPVPVQAQIAHLEKIQGSSGPEPPLAPDAIPPNGTEWKRWFPAPRDTLVQTGYLDNGDGEVSTGDTIQFPAQSLIVSLANPGYFLTPGAELWFPRSGHSPVDPTGETWDEVFPTWSTAHAIDTFLDLDGSTSITVNDKIISGADTFTVNGIGQNVNTFRPPLVIPTLSEWGILFLIVVMIVMGIRRLRRMRAERI